MASSHQNNFDFLRFAAAVFVWYVHCYALNGQKDPLSSVIHFELSANLGVTVFFVISGYFVTMSYDNHNHLLAYLRNRCLRIWPALCVVVLLSVFVLGPAVTTLSLRAYFTDAETWRYLRSLLVFPLQYKLPGVFNGNPVDDVNGSLWTLQHEVRLYIIIGLLGVLGILRPRLMFVLLAALCALRIYGIFWTPDAHAELFTVRWSKLDQAVKLASLFATGAFLYLARDSLEQRKEFFLFAVVIIVANIYWPTRLSGLMFDLAFAYTIIYIGFLKLPLLPAFSYCGDFSYGFYLYAFPVQQLCIHLMGRTSNFNTFLLASFSITLLCAVASWHFVEKPTLAMKR